jgi:hypothetical protein
MRVEIDRFGSIFILSHSSGMHLYIALIYIYILKVRKLCKRANLNVLRLVRVRIGPFDLRPGGSCDTLKSGDVRSLFK